jgi:hypothetical protein
LEGVITGTLTVIGSSDPEADRAFFPDVLGFDRWMPVMGG